MVAHEAVPPRATKKVEAFSIGWRTGLGKSGWVSAQFAPQEIAEVVRDHASRGTAYDLVLLGKALGGGIVALSAVCADEAVPGVLEPGSHGSTFGGNPLAMAVGNAVLVGPRRDGAPQLEPRPSGLLRDDLRVVPRHPDGRAERLGPRGFSRRGQPWEHAGRRRQRRRGAAIEGRAPRHPARPDSCTVRSDRPRTALAPSGRP